MTAAKTNGGYIRRECDQCAPCNPDGTRPRLPVVLLVGVVRFRYEIGDCCLLATDWEVVPQVAPIAHGGTRFYQMSWQEFAIVKVRPEGGGLAIVDDTDDFAIINQPAIELAPIESTPEQRKVTEDQLTRMGLEVEWVKELPKPDDFPLPQYASPQADEPQIIEKEPG